MKPSEYKLLSLKFTRLVTSSRTCPFCRGDKRLKMYVCLECWNSFQDDTRRALSIADGHVMARLMGLVEFAAGNTRPGLVQISRRGQARYGPVTADRLHLRGEIQSMRALLELGGGVLTAAVKVDRQRDLFGGGEGAQAADV